MTYLPFISIVTPSYNQASFIEEALESVRLQSHQNLEHLVIDGMSTDNTTKILLALRSEENGSKVKWISEPDGGQSEALNKGFRNATGDIVGWLNSDDRYRDGCFEKVIQAFARHPDVDVIYGDYALVDESGRLLRIRREISFDSFVLRYHRVLYIATTATFFRRRVFDEGNMLDESLHYAMDYDFFLRLASKGYKFKHISEILADYRLQPASKTCSAPLMQRLEHNQVVLASSPILRRIKLVFLQHMVFCFLRLIAAISRYSQKLLRGYYWKKSRPEPA